MAQAYNLQENPFGQYESTPNPSSNEWHNMTGEQEGRRESLIGKVTRRAGEAAAWLSGVVNGNSADATLQRMQKVTDRADGLMNGRAADTLSYTPGVGKYINTAQNAVNIAQSTLRGVDTARQSIGTMNEIGFSTLAKSTLKEGAIGALDSLSDQTGVSMDRQNGRNKLQIKKRQLGKYVLDTIVRGGVAGGLVATGTEALSAGTSRAQRHVANTVQGYNYQPTTTTPNNQPNSPFGPSNNNYQNRSSYANNPFAQSPQYSDWQQPTSPADNPYAASPFR